MKRLLTLLIAAMMLLSLFAGCAKTKTSSSDTSSTASVETKKEEPKKEEPKKEEPKKEETKKEEPKKEEKKEEAPVEEKSIYNETGYPIMNELTTFTAYNSWETEAAPWGDDQAIFRAMRDLTNIDWEFSNIPYTEYETKLNLEFAAGIYYDYYPSWAPGEILYNYGVKGGVLYEFSDKIKDVMPNLWMLQETYPDILKIVTENDGGIYTVPEVCYTATAGTGNVYVRTDYLAEAGFDHEPTTVDEFYDVLVGMQKTVGQRIDGFIPYLPYSVGQINRDNEMFIFAALGDYANTGFNLDENGKVIYAGATEQMRRYFEFMSKIYKEKLFNNEAYTMEPATALAMIQSGQTGVTTYGTVISMDSFPSGNYDVSLMAPLTSEYSNVQKIDAQMPISKSGRCISTQCEYPDAILRWIDVLYSQEDVAPGLNAISMWLGIRGETWDYTDDTKKFYARLAPEGTENINVWVVSYAAPQTHYGLNFTAIADDASAGLKVKGLGYLEKHLPYEVEPFPSRYFVFSDADTERYQNLWTDISAYIDEMKAKFISGVESVDNFDKYVETLDKMMIGEVCEIMQRGYDAFMAQ
ncbi:MAG: extracellular solute-binding protein [Clostridiales bacterium]|nr:extracellular solute-binding protein [Clostridiales bacterium]